MPCFHLDKELEKFQVGNHNLNRLVKVKNTNRQIYLTHNGKYFSGVEILQPIADEFVVENRAIGEEFVQNVRVDTKGKQDYPICELKSEVFRDASLIYGSSCHGEVIVHEIGMSSDPPLKKRKTNQVTLDLKQLYKVKIGNIVGTYSSQMIGNSLGIVDKFQRRFYIYDLEKGLKQSVPLKMFPNLITKVTINEDSFFCVAEEGVLSLWDYRCPKQIRLVQKPSSSQILGFDQRKNKVGIVSEDRLATIFDVRKWTSQYRWKHTLKYEPSWIGLDETNTCYIAGFDHAQLRCGDYSKLGLMKSSRGIHASSPWVGLHHENGFVVGLSRDGRYYFMKNLRSTIAWKKIYKPEE